MTLAELDALSPVIDESPLAHALRRVADDVTRAREPIAGFNSAL